MTTMEWQDIASAPKDVEVLLCWTYADAPDAPQRVHLGTFFHEVLGGPVFKCELDFGDFSAMVFTDKHDPPSHWMPILASPIGAA